MTEKSPTMRPARAGAAKPSSAVTTAVSAAGVEAADRAQRIATAAYFRAERRGFAGGSAEQDWLEAEAEVDGAVQERV